MGVPDDELHRPRVLKHTMTDCSPPQSGDYRGRNAAIKCDGPPPANFPPHPIATAPRGPSWVRIYHPMELHLPGPSRVLPTVRQWALFRCEDAIVRPLHVLPQGPNNFPPRGLCRMFLGTPVHRRCPLWRQASFRAMLEQPRERHWPH